MMTVEPDQSIAADKRRRLIRLTLIASLAFVLIAAYGVRVLHWSQHDLWVFGAGISVVTGAMVVAVARAGGAVEPESEARRRYKVAMVRACALFAFGAIIATLLQRQGHIAGAVLWLLPLLPMSGAVVMVWAMARFVREETDEYLRTVAVRQALFGNRVLLIVATGWGFLEQFGRVPHMFAWLALPVFMAAMLFAVTLKNIHP